MFQIESRSDATLVYVRSAIDYAGKAEFSNVLRLACERLLPLIVSLEDCPYIDCAGLSALVTLRNTALVPVSVLLRGDTFLWKLFAITGLLRRLHVTVSRTAVVAA